MEKIWQLRPQTETELAAQLLANRGIFGHDKIEDFLDTSYERLHDPFIFKDMAKAVDRILLALSSREKIVIYSDYDADAITANALLFRLFKILGATPEKGNMATGGEVDPEATLDVYIPDRFSEGYGLNLAAFETIKKCGAKVVVTVDCGTNSVEEAKYCRENGIDLIITDHHEVTGELPQAFALINPKNPEEKYPFDQLVGVGVAFKLASALLMKAKDYRSPSGALIEAAQTLPVGFEKWLLDFVAIGTIADCHSLMGENRILVKYGLRVMGKTKWAGLQTLLQAAGVAGKPLDTYTAGFIIAPRINAAGRIDHAKGAFDLLVTDNPQEAAEGARALDALNVRRQQLTENVMSEAREQLALLSDRKILLAAGVDWPKGVVGLVAGKLTEEFGKPVLVMERGPEHSTGSARSVPNFNIVEALKRSSAVLVKYGGHAAAAGFTLRTENIEVLYKNLLEFAELSTTTAEPIKVIDIEAELKPEQFNLDTVALLEKFEPFGVDNVKPKFMISGVQVESTNAVGKDGKHLQLSISAQLANGSRKLIKCIGFNFGKSIGALAVGQKIDLVFELICDEWHGIRTPKMRIIDFRPAGQSELI